MEVWWESEKKKDIMCEWKRDEKQKKNIRCNSIQEEDVQELRFKWKGKKFLTVGSYVSKLNCWEGWDRTNREKTKRLLGCQTGFLLSCAAT